MTTIQIKRSIRNFGIVFALIGIMGLYSILLQYNSSNHPLFIKYFVIIVFSFKLLMGILIIIRNKIGLYYLLFALNIIYLGYPIGTQISKKYSKYVKQYLQEEKEKNG